MHRRPRKQAMQWDHAWVVGRKKCVHSRISFAEPQYIKDDQRVQAQTVAFSYCKALSFEQFTAS